MIVDSSRLLGHPIHTHHKVFARSRGLEQLVDVSENCNGHIYERNEIFYAVSAVSLLSLFQNTPSSSSLLLNHHNFIGARVYKSRKMKSSEMLVPQQNLPWVPVTG